MSTLLENNRLVVILQFALVVLALIAWVVIYIVNKVAEPTLTNLLVLSFGFFFGAQINEMLQKVRR